MAAEVVACSCREAAAKLNVNREAVLRDIARNSGVAPGAAGSNSAKLQCLPCNRVVLDIVWERHSRVAARVAEAVECRDM